MASQAQVEFYDNFIGHFDAQKNNARNAQFREFVTKWTPPNSRVLDFGCAFGYNSGWLAQSGIGCTVVGIDISPKCIEKANYTYGDCKWYAGDITEGFDPGERDFDRVLTSDVLEHIPEHRLFPALEKLATWTKPGGVLLAAIPNADYLAEIKQTTPQPVEEPVYLHLLLGALRAVGFKTVVQVYSVGNLYYRIVVQKPQGGGG